MTKSRDAFRTISEVAEWLDTPAHVLRFWESKFTQVKPVKRAGGRRYYRPSDMELLGGIKKLLHEDGMTIKGVQKILREKGVKHVAAMSPEIDSPHDSAPDVEAAVTDTARSQPDSARQDAAPAPVEDAPFTHVADDAQVETVVPFQPAGTPAPTPEARAEDVTAPGRDDADIAGGTAPEIPAVADAAAVPGAPVEAPTDSDTAPQDVPEAASQDEAQDDTQDATQDTNQNTEATNFEGDSGASPLPSFLQQPLSQPDDSAPAAADNTPPDQPANTVETVEALAPDTETADAAKTEFGDADSFDFARVLAETPELPATEDSPGDASEDARPAEDTPVEQDVTSDADLEGAETVTAADTDTDLASRVAEAVSDSTAAPAPLVPDREVAEAPDLDALEVQPGPLSYLPLGASPSPEQRRALGPLVRKLRDLTEARGGPQNGR